MLRPALLACFPSSGMVGITSAPMQTITLDGAVFTRGVGGIALQDAEQKVKRQVFLLQQEGSQARRGGTRQGNPLDIGSFCRLGTIEAARGTLGLLQNT